MQKSPDLFSPTTLVLAIMLALSGCTHTLTMRTGRVLDAGENRMLVAAGAAHTPEPLGVHSAKSTRHAFPTERWMPQATAGVRKGLGGGWEVAGGFTLPWFIGATGSVRKSIVDTPKLALAVSVDAAVSDSRVVTLQSGSWTVLSVRNTLDISAHWDGLAIYASPGWMAMGHRNTVYDEDGENSESTWGRQQMVGGAAGARLGRVQGAYVEVGYWQSLGNGKTLIVPAIGFEGLPPEK